MSLELSTPNEFPAFPYNPPYEIQVNLMKHLYTSIEQRKVTIVESPTGTASGIYVVVQCKVHSWKHRQGKTLSLLCASLTWLADERDRARKGKLNSAVGDDPNTKSWVIEQTRQRIMRELEAEEQEYQERLQKARKKEAAMRRMAQARVVKKQKHKDAQDSMEAAASGHDEDDEFLPEDEEGASGDGLVVSATLRALMAKVEGKSASNPYQQEAEPTCTKVYYASRTHSQLSQVLPELQRLKLVRYVQSHHKAADENNAQSKRKAEVLEAEDVPEPCARTVALGSRKQLCVNDQLRARSRDLDEACRELLGEKGEKRCEFLPQIDEEDRMLDFRDQILATPKDIEDLAEAGRIAHTCPYFGSRRAIPQAELVTLPYNLLLQKSAREALEVDLKDQIVIIDEAHNVIPTLLSLSTCHLPANILSVAFSQVCHYVSKFRTRLAPRHMVQLKRLVIFLDALTKFVSAWKEERQSKAKQNNGSSADAKTEIITVAELLEKLGRKAAAVNLLEVEVYLKQSKVARKIASYNDKEAAKDGEKVRKGQVPPLRIVEDFMLALTGTNEDGRVTISLVSARGQEEVELKYQLLNPAPHFAEVIEEARCVILAGGTMSPISDVMDQLFPTVSPERLTSFSCGHIIPSENLKSLVLKKGPRGGILEYKAGKQNDGVAMGELGQILLNLVTIVPSGMIVFFPSYSFLNGVKTIWANEGLMEKFGAKKKVFFEPEESSDVDRTLQEYATSVRSSPGDDSQKKGGALLFAVIGAKLSEGLNFADDLARAVVVVGLPYANLGSPELRERLRYVKTQEEKRIAGGMKRASGKRDAAAELYENMCMNAVNQSIGRAIRHKNDWAALILLDQRYSTPAIRGKLPKWIGNSVTVAEGFGQAVKELASFYRGKKPS
ncbi:hypothetical protein AX16_005380 [Volvariella volvacea WC 439]|nr:hypothetical protein AX16_005380 [Volvariella volvacea WC 439]